MSYALTSFKWSVDRHGYDIDEPAGYPGVRGYRPLFFESDLLAAGQTPDVEEYDAAKRGPLHWEFAKAPHSPEGILQFINAHGLPFDGFNSVKKVMHAHDWMRKLLHVVRAPREGYRERAAEMVNNAPVLFRLKLDFSAGVSRQLTLAPTSLFSFMVLLVVADLQGIEWRSCSWCKAMFKVSDARASGKMYCSDNCRQRAFQAKQKARG